MSRAAAIRIQSVYVVAGLTAEILSLSSLYFSSPAKVIAALTFIASIIVVCMTAVILAVSISATHTEVFRAEAPTDPPRDPLQGAD